MSDAASGPFRLVTTSLGIGGELRRLVLKEERRAGPPPRAFATFRILGDTLVPSFWTRYFRRSPSHKHLKGGMPTVSKQERRDHSPVSRRKEPYETGEWSLSTRGRVPSDLLDAHLLYLQRALDLSSQPSLAEQFAVENVVARVLCFWDDSCGDRVPAIDADLRAFFARSGITIAIEEYPRPFTISDGEKDYRAWV
jgi:hypothetical protein